MCRALHTHHSGAIVSKRVAARWAQATLGEPWAALIAWAAAWSHADQTDNLNDTLNFVRYTLKRSEQTQP